jgi:hypothetical protein
LRWEVVRVFGFFFEYLHLRDIFVVLVKGQLAHQQCVEYDAETPDIHLFSRILLPLQHLGRTVAHRAAPCLQVVGLALVFSREAEVDQLDVAVLVEQDVLEFQVAVDAGLVVDVCNGADELGEDALDLGRFEGAVVEEVVVQFVACRRVRCAR